MTNHEPTFSGKVKEELSGKWHAARHCQLAETAAILALCGKACKDSLGRYALKVRTENIFVARKYFTLLRKTFNIKADTLISRNKSKGNVTYAVSVKDHEDAVRVLRETGIMDGAGDMMEASFLKNGGLLKRSCCRRAFLRGAFLAAGSMSHPKKSYHIEIVCARREMAECIRKLILDFGLCAKIILRKKSYVVYLKEGSMIVDLLSIMEAPVALMDMENIRILKDVRNTVNRKVNCETANIHKTVSAAVRQTEDISYIRDTIGLAKLPEGLREIAGLRMAYPNASLKELGELLEEPIGKSGVNHRLRKLSRMAEEMRESKEDLR